MTPDSHPTIFEPALFVTALALALVGVIIGLELLTRVGVTPNTSVIGAMLAMGLARLPMAAFVPFRSIARQNLLQTVISSATFGGANAVFLPLGVAWLVGRRDLVPAMFVGATAGMLVDSCILYWLFDSPIYPAAGAWPAGVATAECLLAGDRGGRRARQLMLGGAVGAVGQWVGIPMDVVGVCGIGNVAALAMFAVGLIVRAQAGPMLAVNLEGQYIPHGVMVGAGLVAVVQIAVALGETGARRLDRNRERMPGRANPFARLLAVGFMLYVVAAATMAAAGGLVVGMPVAQLALFIVFAAIAALVHDLVVGIAAMHAGWFPAFATALIFLILGLLIGFPAAPLALLVGFTASTGPAFADLGYDFKTGWIVRGEGIDPAVERDGRRQQFVAALLGFAVAVMFVWAVHERYFERDRLPPADRVYAATIHAGANRQVLVRLVVWAFPGALIQAAGGPTRQTGVLFATGLLIQNPGAGWAALVALAIRRELERRYGRRGQSTIYVLAGGLLAGSALSSFVAATLE